MATPTSPAATDTITKDDLAASFRGITGEVEEVYEQQRNRAIIIGVGVAVGVVAIAFLLGRRRGQRNRTVVEVRRL